jgi:hypothetical protein
MDLQTIIAQVVAIMRKESDLREMLRIANKYGYTVKENPNV